jgi:hypothetical protein
VYDREISDLAIERAAAHLGFRPRRYPLDHCRSNIEHFDKLWDRRSKKLVRDLRPDEIEWIRNERTICRHDVSYFFPRYYSILSWDGSVRPLDLNVAQRIILDIFAEHERRQIAIALITLKARQLGLTTEYEGFVCHRVTFWPHTQGLVASSDPENSGKMAEIMERAWANMPWWLKPRVTAYNSGESIEFGDQDSAVAIQWLNQNTDLGRGRTPLVAHISEVPDCPDPRSKLDSGLLRAMHESPWMMLVLEGTAKLMGDWWHDTWKSSVAGWPLGTSRLRPVFLPWFVGQDIYPTPAWLRAHPIPPDWKPARLTDRHAERAKAYVRRNDLLRKQLGPDWEMPREQMWFWETTRQEYIEKKALNTFYREMPADDLEAFQTTGASVFDAELIAAYREKAEEPKAVLGLVAKPDVIPLRLQPDQRDFDNDRPRLPVKSPQGARYEFVPLKFADYPAIDPHGKFFIWEWPKTDCDYGFGADTSHGVGQARSAIEMLRKATMSTVARQCAEFASPYVSAADLAPLAHALGLLYTVSQHGQLRQPKAIVETNMNGAACQDALRKLGWQRFHVQVRLNKKLQDVTRIATYGASADAHTRSELLDWLIKAVKDYFIDIDSPWLIAELATLSAQGTLQKLQAEKGAFDDRVFGIGWAFYALHILDRSPMIPVFGQRRMQEDTGPKQYAEWEPEFQYQDLPRDAREIRKIIQPFEKQDWMPEVI